MGNAGNTKGVSHGRGDGEPTEPNVIQIKSPKMTERDARRAKATGGGSTK